MLNLNNLIMATFHEIRSINKSERTNIRKRIVNIRGIKEDRIRWKISQSEAIATI
jgi:hypothetical protein